MLSSSTDECISPLTNVLHASTAELELQEIICEEDQLDVNIWDEDPEDNIMYEPESELPETIRSASFNQLVIALTDDKLSDRDVEVLIYTYQCFSSPCELLVKLIQRFRVPKRDEQTEHEWIENASQIQLRIMKFIYRWMAEQIADFNPPIIQCLNRFLANLPFEQKEIQQEKMVSIKMLNPPPSPKLPRFGMGHSCTLLDIDNEEIARQMCLIESEIFLSIKRTEFFNQSWNKVMSYHKSVNLRRLIQREADTIAWVGCTILREDSSEVRAKVIAKYISIAELLLKMNNFNAFKSIMVGLKAMPISRLKRTMDHLSDGQHGALAKLQSIASENQGHKTLRELQAKASPPGVPFIESTLTELMFIEDGFSNFEDGKMIRFNKCRMIYDVLLPLQPFWKTPYNFVQVFKISALLRDWGLLPTEKQQYELSVRRESES